MEKGGEYMSERNATAPMPADIGRDFAKAFYKMWSVKQNDVFQFYSPESFFSHDGHEAKGKDDIRKTIEQLAYVDCKTRVHSVNGVNGANESCVLQVCGEMAVNNNPPRRFIEVFILSKHSAKSYFVQNDIFQWLDKAFAELPPLNERNSSVEDGNKTETLTATEEEPQENGHANIPTLGESVMTNLPDLGSLTTENVTNQRPISVEDNMSPMDNGGYKTTVEHIAPVNNIFSESKNMAQRSYNETKHAEVAPTPPEPQHPKTWARAVGNSTGYQGGAKVTVQPQQPTSTVADDGKEPLGNPHDQPNKSYGFKDKRGGGSYHNGGFRGNYQRGLPTGARGGGTGGRGGGGGYRNNTNTNFYRGGSQGAGNGPAPHSGGTRFNGERRGNYEYRPDFRRSNQPAPSQNKS